jgi:hypothetical protein
MSETQKENPSSDLHAVRPEPASGRKLTKRGQNMTKENRMIKKRRLEAGARSR